jgi:hypothetical protein
MARGLSSRTCIALVAAVAGLTCGGGPPRFSLEPVPADAAAGDPKDARWISIGSLATPPPGRYRFLRLQAGGAAEVREVQALNGPGPWPTYVGRARVAPAIAAEALRTITGGAPSADPGRTAEPCVLAYGAGSTAEWQGCAFPDVARRVLGALPSLTVPDVSPACTASICQVRVIDGSPPAGHAVIGDVRRDAVIDSGGAVWCAAARADRDGGRGVRHVERAAIVARDSAAVFSWVARGVGEADHPTPGRSVMVRGAGTDWRAVSEADARAVRGRWQQLADRLPEACR